jgi:hypothetical protein
LLSEGLNELAGDFVPMEGVEMADPSDAAYVAVDAKLESVLAESGVDLLDCGLAVAFTLRGDDDLGINVRWLGRRPCFEPSLLMPFWLLNGLVFALSVSKGRRSKPATLLRGAKLGADAGVIARL